MNDEFFKRIGSRIKEAREDAGLSQERLGEALGYSRVQVGNWERGDSRVNLDTLYEIASVLGKPYEWFFAPRRGEPAMSPAPPSEDTAARRLSARYSMQAQDFAREIAEKVEDYLPITKIPLLGTIRAGMPLFAEENQEGEMTVPRELGADFALRVKGDSMVGAGIVEGDIAICQSVQYAQEDAKDGDIVVALVNGDEATLKYLAREGDDWWLVPANPKYPKRKLDPKEDRIQGVVLKIEKRPPKLDEVQSVLLEAYNRAVSQYRDFDEIIKEAAEQGMTPETLHAIVRVWKMSHGTAGAED